METEVLVAFIGGAITLIGIGVTAWQAIRELKVRARIEVATKLVELRHAPYCELWNITASGPGHTSMLATEEARNELADRLTTWYWPNGMLLSGEAQTHWRKLRNTLRDERGEPDPKRMAELRNDLSLLRSWLKYDLFIRTADEISGFSPEQVRQASASQPPADEV